MNRSRCRLGADSCGSIEPCIRWGSRSDESIHSREGWQSAMRPLAKLLWTLVFFGVTVTRATREAVIRIVATVVRCQSHFHARGCWRQDHMGVRLAMHATELAYSSVGPCRNRSPGLSRSQSAPLYETAVDSLSSRLAARNLFIGLFRLNWLRGLEWPIFRLRHFSTHRLHCQSRNHCRTRKKTFKEFKPSRRL